MFEEFKPFPLQEYESRYTISNRGRIYSNRKKDYLIETYSGIKIASRQTGTNSGSIVKVCKGIKPTAGGYKWKYTTS